MRTTKAVYFGALVMLLCLINCHFIIIIIIIIIIKP